MSSPHPTSSRCFNDGPLGEPNESQVSDTDLSDTDSRDWRSRRLSPRQVGVAVAMVSVAILVGSNLSLLSQRFGDSFDGFNGSVWSIGARSMEHDGVTKSRFGAKNDLGTYARHPPAIYFETFVARKVVPNDHAAARLVALASSIAALAILAAVFLELGFNAIGTIAGLGLLATSEMFLVFGSMLDTPIIGLPLSAGALLILLRTLRCAPTPAWLTIGVGLMSALTAWTSIVYVLFSIAAILVINLKKRSSLRPAAHLAIGLVIGLTATLTWVWWAYGSFGELWSTATLRTTSQTATFTQQYLYMRDAWPILLIFGLTGAVVALSSKSMRPIVIVSFLAVVSYASVFRSGANGHEYWNYSGLIVLGIGAGFLFDRLWSISKGRFVPRTVLVGMTAIILVTSLIAPSNARQRRDEGVATSKLFTVMDRYYATHGSSKQDPLLVLAGPRVTDEPWVFYETGGRTVDLLSIQDRLNVMAENQPDLLVMTQTDLLDAITTGGLEPRLVGSGGGLVLTTVSELAKTLNRS